MANYKKVHVIQLIGFFLAQTWMDYKWIGKNTLHIGVWDKLGISYDTFLIDLKK